MPKPAISTSQLLCGERIAGADRALSQSGLEPALALLRAAVRERVRHHIAARLLLQAVVPDRSSRTQCRLDVARLQQLPPLLGLVGPDASETISLQLDPHLDAIRRRPVEALLLLMRLLQNAELVLHVVPDLVCDDVGLYELAGA